MDARDVLSARRFIDPWKCARPDAHSPSSVICIDCPRPWAAIPFLAFYMPHAVRAHLRFRKDHRLAFWCDAHRQVEDAPMTSKWDPATFRKPDPLVIGLLEMDRRTDQIVEQAVEWRRREIARLEDEIVNLLELAALAAAASRDVA